MLLAPQLMYMPCMPEECSATDLIGLGNCALHDLLAAQSASLPLFNMPPRAVKWLGHPKQTLAHTNSGIVMCN
jgi:hypothetical protein